MKIIFGFLLILNTMVLAAADARTVADLYRQGNYQGVLAEFSQISGRASAERNKAGHYAVQAMCKLGTYTKALNLAEELAKENRKDLAWHCRFQFHRMAILKLMERPEEALKIITDVKEVPAAFTGEYYCLRGDSLMAAGRWREAVEVYDWGTESSNDYAGRARLAIARAYEKNGFLLPALEADLQLLSMRHALPEDRRMAFASAIKLLDQVDRNREEVQDVLASLPNELKAVEAGKILVNDPKKAKEIINELIEDSKIPLALRNFLKTI